MKQVTIVVPKGKTNVSCITGSFNILHSANEHWRKMGNRPMLEITIAGFVPELKLDKGFFSVHPVNITETDKPDLVIIPAISYDDHLLKENADLISWIREQYKDGAEIATMCSGVFLLAATGLLEGRNCSTHWNLATNLSRLFPNVNLLPDKLITAERGIYTNGGAYSFLNLILFLVEKYFDRETAILLFKNFPN